MCTSSETRTSASLVFQDREEAPGIGFTANSDRVMGTVLPNEICGELEIWLRKVSTRFAPKFHGSNQNASRPEISWLSHVELELVL